MSNSVLSVDLTQARVALVICKETGEIVDWVSVS